MKIDCGPISVEFFNDDAAKSAINTALFQDDRTTAPNNIFRTLFNDNPLTIGSYPFRYRVFHTNYPTSAVEIPFPFIVTIIKVNSCESPKSIVSSSLENQE